MMNRDAANVVIGAVEKYNAAVRDRMGVELRRKELVNILLSHANEIVDVIRDADDLMSQLMTAQKKLAQMESQAKDEAAKSRSSKPKASE